MSAKFSVLDCDWQVVVAVAQYRSRWPKELDLNEGDMIQVLFKEDQTWWFGRLKNGNEGYFPSACVEPLQVTTHLNHWVHWVSYCMMMM